MDIASGIYSTANALGINPIDLATAISYETSGTFNPLELGPETQFGQHRGLIQFGEPQANQYGVSFETRPQAISTQLGPGAGIYQYLKAVGIQPGMGLKQIYSAINTGGLNNFDMTDSRAGGMPGTVSEKVAGMGDHRKNAEKFMELAMQNQPLNASPLLGAQNSQMPGNQQSSGMDKNPLFSMLGKTVGGGFSKLKDAVTGTDPDASDRLAIALMSLSGNPGQLQPLMAMAAQDIQDRKKTTKQNQTIAYLETVDPKLAEMARANPAMTTQIMQSLAATAVSGKSGKVMTAEQVKELFPDADVKPGLYNVKFKDNKPVEAKPMTSTGNTTIIGGEGNEFQNAAQKAIAEEFKGYINNTSNARQMLGQTNVLGTLLADANTGFGAGLAQFVKNTFNIDVRSDAAAAADALLSQLVPGQRAPGSGTMSDADLLLYKNSLPSIANQPGGNEIILASMRSIAEYQIRMGQIAQKAFTDKTYTPEMAYADMNSLPDPLAGAMAFIKERGIGTGSSEGGGNSNTKIWDPTLNGGAGGFKS